MIWTKRRPVGAVALGALVITAVGWRAAQTVRIGVAYKAKNVCSGIFVSERDPRAVVADLEIDDLSILRHIRVAVDTSSRTVTASALGFLRRRAVYRDGLGCTLLLDGLTPSASVRPGAAFDARDGHPRTQGAIAIASPPDGVVREKLASVIRDAFSEPHPQRPRRTQAVVVVRHGRIVGEHYAAGIDADTPLIGWSMTKSVLNALTGILVG